MIKGRLVTLLRLGVPNLTQLVLYRLLRKSGLLKCQLPYRAAIAGPFYRPLSGAVSEEMIQRGYPPVTSCWLEGSSCSFGWKHMPLAGKPPVWMRSVFTERLHPESDYHCTAIADCSDDVGDIRAIWEASRFDWLLVFARASCCGDKNIIKKLNHWLADWSHNNPGNIGPNWVSTQEASFRVMHLALTAWLLRQVETAELSLVNMVCQHLQRIASTMTYAMALDNNHGISEAAALFIGGSWLVAHCQATAFNQTGQCKRARRWYRRGRYWLENRVQRLIESDGSFSPYSLNDHRLMLDTVSLVEFWRKTLGLPAFSQHFYRANDAATRWLYAFVDPGNGDAPNLGANDGVRLMPLSDTDYRDYRPSVQLAAAMFLNARAYTDAGSYDQPLQWLGLKPVGRLRLPRSQRFDNGGYAILRTKNVMACLRYPRFRFRPSQADALHLDMWINGVNWLRDSGTYSFHSDSRWLNYFPGTAAHNTVQFDERDQMPRLTRCLFGDWLRTEKISPPANDNNVVQQLSVSYRDSSGSHHHRRVCLSDSLLQVYDHVSGFAEKAVLRWRLKPEPWTLNGNVLKGKTLSITLSACVPIKRIELVEGWESRYYLKKTALPVLEVELNEPAVVISEITWH